MTTQDQELKHAIGRAEPGNMKINEIVVESLLRKSADQAASNLSNWPGTYNDPYKAYRFGVAMAGAPDNFTPAEGPIGPNLTTIGYSDADQEMIDMAAKELGLAQSKTTGKGSEEPTMVNKKSPVKPQGPIQLKSEKK